VHARGNPEPPPIDVESQSDLRGCYTDVAYEQTACQGNEGSDNAAWSSVCSRTIDTMVGRTVKIAPDVWIDTARRSLIEEGIAAVKVDRIANRLGVTRGGFYHHFRDREELLAKLLEHWEATCRFLPDEPPATRSAYALEWLDRVVDRLIDEDGYDHQFDLAVREWSRSDQRAAWAVERADRERLKALQRFFETVGYSADEAVIRARVFYYHQIGYYAIGVRESSTERRRNKDTYLDILRGPNVPSAARRDATSPAQKRRARG
jgi:AcrR family transcriptional regulator